MRLFELRKFVDSLNRFVIPELQNGQRAVETTKKLCLDLNFQFPGFIFVTISDTNPTLRVLPE